MTVPPWLAAVGLVSLTIAVYWPALFGDFILDDDIWLTNNPLMQASDGLYRYWFTAEAVDYWPVTGTSFWIEWRLWGLDARGYHVTNLLLHIFSVLLLWRVLVLLAVPGAFLAALLFAVHPVNVESVAWISQRKTLLALFFSLLAALFYLPPTASTSSQPASEKALTSPIRYGLALAAFLLAMLSKGSVAVVPCVLFGLLAWLRPVTKADVARVIPFFLVSLALVPVNMFFQARVTSSVPVLPFLDRTLGAASAVWFYLYKALLPVNLSFIYPLWRVDASQAAWWLPLVAAVGVSVLLPWWRTAAVGRALLLAWTYYGLVLLPVLGFTSISFMEHSLVADHYQHVGLVGIVTLLAAAWGYYRQASSRRLRQGLDGVAIFVVAWFALLTWWKAAEYKSPIALYEATLARNPDTFLIHNNLGLALMQAKRPLEEAMAHLEKAVALKPDYAAAQNNLGYVLLELGRGGEAEAHFREALHLSPEYAEAHQNLGRVLHRTLRTQEALEHYREAARIRPNVAEHHYGISGALVSLGQVAEARASWARVLELDPNHAGAHNDLGAALFQDGKSSEAVSHYEQALRAKPDFAEAHYNLGVAQFQAQQLPSAIAHFREAIRLQPNNSHTYNDLGVALVGVGQIDDAITQFREALRVNPDDRDAKANLEETLAMKTSPLP